MSWHVFVPCNAYLGPFACSFLCQTPSTRRLNRNLCISTYDLLDIAPSQSVTVTSGVLGRAESGYSAEVYAPKYAPHPTEFALRAEPQAGRFVTCSVRERKPYPIYARHNLSVPTFKLAALA